MTKKELSNLLHDTGCPVNEGITVDLKKEKIFPRIDYWEILWDYVRTSGGRYADKVTRQISFYAKKPRDEKLLKLRKKLNEVGIYPVISHEYVAEDRIWQSYFAIETIEDEI